MTTQTTSKTVEMCSQEMKQLQQSYNSFKQEMIGRLNRSDNDTKIQFQNILNSQQIQLDTVNEIRTNLELTRETNEK